MAGSALGWECRSGPGASHGAILRSQPLGDSIFINYCNRDRFFVDSFSSATEFPNAVFAALHFKHEQPFFRMDDQKIDLSGRLCLRVNLVHSGAEPREPMDDNVVGRQLRLETGVEISFTLAVSVARSV